MVSSPEIARRVMETYLAADLSAESGEPVNLPLNNQALSQSRSCTRSSARRSRARWLFELNRCECSDHLSRKRRAIAYDQRQPMVVASHISQRVVPANAGPSPCLKSEKKALLQCRNESPRRANERNCAHAGSLRRRTRLIENSICDSPALAERGEVIRSASIVSRRQAPGSHKIRVHRRRIHRVLIGQRAGKRQVYREIFRHPRRARR